MQTTKIKTCPVPQVLYTACCSSKLYVIQITIFGKTAYKCFHRRREKKEGKKKTKQHR
jgi:hypothetical protein